MFEFAGVFIIPVFLLMAGTLIAVFVCRQMDGGSCRILYVSEMYVKNPKAHYINGADGLM